MLNSVVALEPEIVRKRKRDKSLIEADRRLAQWAKWARENRQILGYPSVSSLFRVMMDSKRHIKTEKEQREIDKKRQEGKLYEALGKQTANFREDIQHIPDTIAEIDKIVARLPRPLEVVVTAYYFTYGPIEVKARAAGHKKAKFCQLLEAAKYSVWTALNTTDVQELSCSPD